MTVRGLSGTVRGLAGTVTREIYQVTVRELARY